MKRTPLRWRTVVLVALSVLIGIVVAAPPVGAHVGGTVQHLWRDHIRPKADARYLNDSISVAAVGPLPGTELGGDGVGNDNSTCEANETCIQAVTCPGDDALVVNGGFREVDRGSVVIASYPGLFNEWDVYLTNDGTVDDFVVNAHCINR
jgi:hypothetical protein